ncbi:hypothetical protein [Nocardia sp. NPDC004711]
MIRLRLRRRSLAIAGAVCLAAAALVAVSVPAEAAGPIVVYGDYREHTTPLPIRAGAVANSAPKLLVA